MSRMYTSPPKFSQIPSVIREDVPVYMLEENCYFDDTHWLSGAILETTDSFIPNIAMFPLNEFAKEYVVAMLTEYDAKGREWSEKERKAYVPKLPTFLEKWERTNAIAKQRRMSLIMVLKTNQVPILGAPLRERSVTEVDMTSVPQLPYQEDSAIGRGTTMDRDMMSPVNAVRQSVA